jgi:hypothetical protein
MMIMKGPVERASPFVAVVPRDCLGLLIEVVVGGFRVLWEVQLLSKSR